MPHAAQNTCAVLLLLGQHDHFNKRAATSWTYSANYEDETHSIFEKWLAGEVVGVGIYGS